MSNDQPNKPNWVDKANLASNVAQNIQLRQLQSTLETTGAMQLENLKLAHSEQQLTERENLLREHLWQFEQNFDALLRNSVMTPCGIFILAEELKDVMAQGGMTTASFRQFADKDRLGALSRRIEEALESTRARISAEQKTDLDAYLLYRSEGRELDELIGRLRAESERRDRLLVDAKNQQEFALQNVEYWRKMANSPDKQKEYADQERNRRRAEIGSAILIGPTILAWVVSCVLFVPINDLLNGMPFDSKLFEVGIVGMVIAIACSVRCYQLSEKSKPEMSIGEQLARAERKLSIADAQISSSQPGVYTSWDPEPLTKFQAKDLPELLQRQQERNEFMEQFRQVNSLPVNDSSFKQRMAVPRNVQLVMPPEVRARIPDRATQKLWFIRAYMEQSPGVSVAEAKAAVEAYLDEENRKIDS